MERADVLGYSQGGGVALQLALRHPRRVNKLVSLSATYRKDGWYLSVMKAMEGLNAKVFTGSPVQRSAEPHPMALANFRCVTLGAATVRTSCRP